MGTRRVRALLDSDRRSANEVRPEVAEVQLRTADYVTPLRVRLKRSFREDDRVRVGSLLLSIALAVALLGGLASTLGTARASHENEPALPLTAQDTLRVRSPTLPVSYHPLAAPVRQDREEIRPIPRDRLQHARRVLKSSGADGAAKARSLLEELVRDRPRNGRAYASLAEACLRLSDARCAREAVTKAVARQPRRAKYRALAGRIERTFASASD